MDTTTELRPEELVRRPASGHVAVAAARVAGPGVPGALVQVPAVAAVLR